MESSMVAPMTQRASCARVEGNQASLMAASSGASYPRSGFGRTQPPTRSSDFGAIGDANNERYS
jgi:hypothetical protein